jgi:hypothetical protein
MAGQEKGAIDWIAWYWYFFDWIWIQYELLDGYWVQNLGWHAQRERWSDENRKLFILDTRLRLTLLQMVSEMMKEKRHQSRAFMLLPMTGNIGQIIGPMLGMTFPNLEFDRTNNHRWFLGRSNISISRHLWQKHFPRRNHWSTVDD